MTTFIAVVFMLIAIAAAAIGVVTMQLELALVGLLFAGVFSALLLLTGQVHDLRREVRELAMRRREGGT